ncbi:MAG TPA: hypothetical protein VMU95_34260 [Trebonia sp.]|nr:hypothetical protein [Trebonia sp.]
MSGTSTRRRASRRGLGYLLGAAVVVGGIAAGGIAQATTHAPAMSKSQSVLGAAARTSWPAPRPTDWPTPPPTSWPTPPPPGSTPTPPPVGSPAGCIDFPNIHVYTVFYTSPGCGSVSVYATKGVHGTFYCELPDGTRVGPGGNFQGKTVKLCTISPNYAQPLMVAPADHNHNYIISVTA